MTQLILPLDHRPALGREDFLVSECNRAAVAWIDQWEHWPSHTLMLYGPEGCGKSHLAHVYMKNSGAKVINAADLDEMRDQEPPRHILVEDAPPGSQGEEGLFHLINWVREARGSLLITSRQAPQHWSIALPDLRSRVSAMTATQIGAPDDELLQAVLVKLFYDRQIDVAENVVNFLAARIERSFQAAREWVARIDEAALAQKKPITIPLIRQLMQDE
ncbi:MAG: DnaA/Hda family protein [Sphingomonadales bacterium]|jgi:chromosomal replication initiation ATPase DnaA